MSPPATQKPPNAESAGSFQSGHRRKIRCIITYLTFGFICLFLGVLSIRYDFQELALNERIKVRPGLPPYTKWRNPSGIDFSVKLYLFAVENPNEFLANKTAKLKLKEIGPIYYKRRIRQEDIVFHDDDSTLSFSSVSELEFLEEMNEPGILNKTIILFNPIMLGLAAMIHDQLLPKMVFDVVAKMDHVFINRTVYEALWNSTSPMLEMVKKIPFAAPRPNAGVMFNSFYPTPTRYNVNIGPKHGFENFFKINTLNGVSRINVYEEHFPKHCPYTLKGACEGTGLPPRISKNATVYVYCNNLCRTLPMVYNQTVKFLSLDAYQFIYDRNIFIRLKDPSKDCLKTTLGVPLPDGLSDSARCAFGTPIAISNPHFWGFHGIWENSLDGLEPVVKDHSSYMLIEPTTGIQLEAAARLQSNIILPGLEYFPKNISRFSNMILPQFWMDYSAHNEDPIIHGMIFLALNLPVIQPIIVIILLVLSIFFIYKAARLVFAVNLTRTGKRSVIIYPTTTDSYKVSDYCDDAESMTT